MVKIAVESPRGADDESEARALIAELRGYGFDTELRAVGDDRFLAPFGQDLIVHLLESGGDQVVSALVGAITATLSQRIRKSRRARRRVVILGPDGEPLRVLEVPGQA